MKRILVSSKRIQDFIKDVLSQSNHYCRKIFMMEYSTHANENYVQFEWSLKAAHVKMKISSLCKIG